MPVISFSQKAMRSLLAVLVVLLLCTNAWAETRSVRVKKANFRETPSDTADVLFTAEQYYPVKILERKRGWARVKDFEGEIAWVADRLLGSQKSVVIIVEKVMLRDKPRSDGAPVLEASWSDSFAVVQSQSGWLLLESASGKKGWVGVEFTWGVSP